MFQFFIDNKVHNAIKIFRHFGALIFSDQCLKFVGVNVFKIFKQTVLNYLFLQKWLSYINACVSVHVCMHVSLQFCCNNLHFFYMFSTLNNTCGKTVLMMEEQQGLCHSSLYCKAVFSKILHHATSAPPPSPISKGNKKVNMV